MTETTALAPSSIDDVINSVSFGKLGILFLIILVMFAVLFFLSRKTSKKNKEHFKNEIAEYYNAFAYREPDTPSGIITYVNNELFFARGSNKILIDVCILPAETYLCPALISEWFNNRNYTLKEETRILNDIKSFILNNKLSKQVSIITDEEYESIFEPSSEEN